MQNYQLPIKTPVELKDNSSIVTFLSGRLVIFSSFRRERVGPNNLLNVAQLTLLLSKFIDAFASYIIRGTIWT